VKINVMSVSPAPPAEEMALHNDSASTSMNNPVTIHVKANDTIPDAGSVMTVPSESANGGKIVINPDGTVTYTPPTDFVGEDSFEYTITTPDGKVDSAKVTITVTAPANLVIRAIDDEFETYVNEPVSDNIIANDINPVGKIIVQTTPFNGPANGTVIINADGTFVYTPNLDFSGEDSFSYQICNSILSTTCGVAVVTITVQDTAVTDPDPLTPCDNFEVFIPNGFSPNDDGINDYFVVTLTCESGSESSFAPEFAERFPNAKVEIYNRWGNLVFEKEGFGNTDRWGSTDAWWDGRSNKGLTVGKDKLPSATYFYILYFNDGNKEPVAGSIFLNR
jgi:gliding motility-associated-like protein